MVSDLTALVTDIQRFSIHDGPGIRTTIFFKGCPLACRWCHNPETIRFKNEVIWNPARCIGCGDCVRVCPTRALTMSGRSILRNHQACTGCLACTRACPTTAASAAAEPRTVEDLVQAVIRDRDYYQESGGVTLSGGEPLAHPDFIRELLPRLRREKIHITVETSCQVSPDLLQEVEPLVDLFLVDLKAASPDRHRLLTGRGNERILENLGFLAKRPEKLVVRMPLVPGWNNSPEDLAGAADLLAGLGLDSLTILPWHPLGQGKLRGLAEPYQPVETHSPTREELTDAVDLLAERGIRATTG